MTKGTHHSIKGTISKKPFGTKPQTHKLFRSLTGVLVRTTRNSESSRTLPGCLTKVSFSERREVRGMTTLSEVLVSVHTNLQSVHRRKPKCHLRR